MTHKITLTAEQQKYVQELAEVLDFGHGELSKTNFTMDKIKTRNRIMLAMFVAAHNYTESIYVLAKEARTHGCDVLLRALFENWINAKYIFCSTNYEKPARFILNGEYELLNTLQQLKKYRNDYPLRDTSQAAITDKWLNDTIKKLERNITILGQKYPNIKRSGSVRTRSKAVDDYNYAKGRKVVQPLEWNYLLIYKHLCETSHLTVRGLNSFIEKTTTGYNVQLSGDANEVEKVVVSAHAWYLDTLNMFSQQFGIPTRKDIKPYLDKLKSYHKK